MCAAGRCAGNGRGTGAPGVRAGGCSGQGEKAEGTAGLCCQQDFVFGGRSREEKGLIRC